MNVRKFVARTGREALTLVRAELGDEAVVLKTRSVEGGVEVTAMADEADVAAAAERASEAPVARAVAAPAPARAQERSQERAVERAPARPLAGRPMTVKAGLPPRAAAAPADAVVDSRTASAQRGALAGGPRGNVAPRAAVAPAGTAVAFKATAPAKASATPVARPEPAARVTAARLDVEDAPMSTLSFQQFVRDRLARRLSEKAAAQEDERVARGQAETRAERGSFAERTAQIERTAQAERAAQTQSAAQQEAFEAQDAVAEHGAFEEHGHFEQHDAIATHDSTEAHEALDAHEAFDQPEYDHDEEFTAEAFRQVAARAQPAPQAPAASRSKSFFARPDSADWNGAGRRERGAVFANASDGAGAPSIDDLMPGRSASGQGPEASVMTELREMRGLISNQLSSMAWFDGVRRDPIQVHLLRKLIACGFSSRLARKLVSSLPSDRTGAAAAERWIADTLTRLIRMDAPGETLLERGGVYALVGPTGVGKTTSTAKIAAQFALRHGAQSVALVTVDAYRIGAQDQLRTFGRLLGVPVHVVHDAGGMAEFMNVFMNRKLVLIDTVGIGQRDERLSELLGSLSSKSIRKLLVLNSAVQAETLEDVIAAYRADNTFGTVISKLDEAVKVGGVLDCLIRHRLPLVGSADGQRVPEDWHHPDPAALVTRALATPADPVFDLDDNELSLLLAPASRDASQAGAARGARHV